MNSDSKQVDREDIRRFYRILRHGDYGVTEVRVLPQGARPYIGYFDNEEDFVATCAQWSGKANVYAGRNPRPKEFFNRYPRARNQLARGVGGAKSEDIATITMLSLDIDPMRPKGEPSTDAEHQRALDKAAEITADYPGAVLVDSGNGSQVLFPVTLVSVNGDASSMERRTRAWEEEIRRDVEEDPALQLDYLFDLQRIIKVPGTLSVKGTSTEDRPHRLARIVGEVPEGLCDMSEVFEREVPEAPAEITEGNIPACFERLLDEDERVRATWEGERIDLRDHSASGYDMAMIGLLLQRQYSAGEIQAILREMPSGTQDLRRIKGSLRKAMATLETGPSGGGKREILAADAADAFLRDRHLRGKLHRWRNDWWLWRGGSYDRLSDEECQALVVSYLREKRAFRHKATQTFVRNVLLNLAAVGTLPERTDLPFWIRDEGAERAPSLVVLQNGIGDLDRYAGGETDVLRDHTPAFFCPTVLPYDFDPTATCPRWIQFLGEVLPDSASRRLLQEWFGYNLVYDLRYQHFLILEGEGANGKSVVCHVLRHLVGPANVSAVPLELFGTRFQLGPTIGKLANICPEMGEMDRVAEGFLKPFVSGDAMQFDRKNKEPITATPTARLTLATNTRPRFTDRSEGVWRRLLLLPFPNQIPEERQDRQLGEALLGELPGIFNWAVQGLQRLRERGHFIEPASSREAKEDYRRETNPARCFLEEECENDPREDVEKQTLYQKYKGWAMERGYRHLGLAQFAKEVMRVYPAVIVTRPRKSGNRVQMFEGLHLIHD